MKIRVIVILLSIQFSTIFCQKNNQIDIHADIKQTTKDIYKLIITIHADSMIYAVSMFHDSNENQLIIPLTIEFNEDKYIKPIGAWEETPRAKIYNHSSLEKGLYIRKPTKYAHSFKIKSPENFKSIFNLSIWVISEKSAWPPETISFEIIHFKKKFRVNRLDTKDSK